MTSELSLCWSGNRSPISSSSTPSPYFVPSPSEPPLRLPTCTCGLPGARRVCSPLPLSSCCFSNRVIQPRYLQTCWFFGRFSSDLRWSRCSEHFLPVAVFFNSRVCIWFLPLMSISFLKFFISRDIVLMLQVFRCDFLSFFECICDRIFKVLV